MTSEVGLVYEAPPPVNHQTGIRQSLPPGTGAPACRTATWPPTPLPQTSDPTDLAPRYGGPDVEQLRDDGTEDRPRNGDGRS